MTVVGMLLEALVLSLLLYTRTTTCIPGIRLSVGTITLPSDKAAIELEPGAATSRNPQDLTQEV